MAAVGVGNAVGMGAAPARVPLDVSRLGEGDREAALEYDEFLAELTFNSKIVINNLTQIAGENQHIANAIVYVVETRLSLAIADNKLPLFYLLDSICKNIGRPFPALFKTNLSKLYLDAYPLCSPKVQGSLQRLLGTWAPVFGEDFVAHVRAKLMELTTTMGQPTSLPAQQGSGALRMPAHRLKVPPMQTHQPQPVPHPLQVDFAATPHVVPQHQQQQMMNPADTMASLQRETDSLVATISAQLVSGLQPTPEQLQALGNLIAIQLQFATDPARHAQLTHLNKQLSNWAAGARMQHSANTHTKNTMETNGKSRAGRNRARHSNRVPVKNPLCSSLEEIRKTSHVAAVKLLYEDLPFVSKLDGMRLRTNDELREHLDWLFVQHKRKRTLQAGGLSRRWYLSFNDWLRSSSNSTTETVQPTASGEKPGLSLDLKEKESDLPSGGAVVGDEERCPVCGEGFELSWDDEKGAWVSADAWRESDDGPVVHLQCLALTSPQTPGTPKTSLKRTLPQVMSPTQEAKRQA